MKESIHIKLNLILFLLLFSRGFASNVYFVAMEGDNSNQGTFKQPWKTIRYAVKNIQAGDTVNIKSGVYPGTIYITTSGTPQSPIVIKNFNDDSVTIDVTNKYFGIIFGDCHNITIKGLSIRGCKNFRHRDQSNIFLRGSSSHIIIQECNIYDGINGIYINRWTQANYISIINCKIHDNAHSGIYLNGPYNCAHHLISKNNIYSNGFNGTYIKCDSSLIEDNNIYNNNKEGIFMDAFSERHFHHNVVRRNHIYGNGNNGIMFAGQDYCLIYENEIHDNGWQFDLKKYANALHGIYMLLSEYNIIYNNKMYNHANGGGVRLEGKYNVVMDNDFFNNGNGMYGCCTYGFSNDNIVRNNRMYGNKQLYDGKIPGSGFEADGQKGLYLYNNVFFDLPGFGFAFVNGDRNNGEKANVKNNIIMKAGWNLLWIKEENEVGYKEDYNNIYPDKANAIRFTGTEYDLTGYIATTGQGVNTISQDPLFVDQANNDFRLAPNSPCINAGGFLTITTRSGCGTQIPIQDAKWFCDGNGIIQGDLIQLEGQTQTARITNIDYDNNVLTIDAFLIWKKKQGISLPYNGSAPDIGAFEYKAEKVLSAAINLSEPSPIYQGDVFVTITINRTVIKIPTPLFFMESDSTISTIELSGDIPGNTFTGIFVVDSMVSHGKGYFFLSEGVLEDEYGNTSNLIISNNYFTIAPYNTKVDPDGIFKYSNNSITQINIPEKFELSQNYPNPFNTETIIKYTVAKKVKVSLIIYDLLGREVRKLLDEFKNAGFYVVKWNRKDNDGNDVNTGIYFCQMKGEGFSKTMKLTLTK